MNAGECAVVRCPCGSIVRGVPHGEAVYATCRVCGRTLRWDARTGRLTVVSGEPQSGGE